MIASDKASDAAVMADAVKAPVERELLVTAPVFKESVVAGPEIPRPFAVIVPELQILPAVNAPDSRKVLAVM